MSGKKDTTPLVEVPSHVPEASNNRTESRTATDISDNGKISVPSDNNNVPTSNYTKVEDNNNNHNNNNNRGYNNAGEIEVPPTGSPPAYGSEAAPSQINLTTVRLQYGLVLLLGMILCLVLNYHGITWLFKWAIEKEMADNCVLGRGADDLSECLGAQGVYRVSFTLFIFFLIHYIGSHHNNLCLEPQSKIDFNHGRIFWKIIAAIGVMFVTFVIPNSFFVFFAWLSFVLSIFFLIGQLLVLIEFAYSWAEDWSAREDQRYPRALLGCTIVMMVGALVIISLGFKFFGSNSDCGGNQAALILTLIAGVFYIILSVHIGKGTIVPASVVFIYTSWTCFSALSSDSPPACSEFHSTGVLQLILSGVFTAASLVVSTLSAATSRDAFSTTEMTATGLEADSLLLEHFHLMMMFASSYLSMLVTNWTIVGDTSMANIYGSRNQASLGAKLGSEALCVVLFIITLVAPMICKKREF